MRRALVVAQGSYYIATGAWPLLHLPSLELLTGPKHDDWLVHMVGLLAVAIGAVLVFGGGRVTRPETLLSVLTAVSFTLIDVVYVSKGVRRPVYLADAAVEVLIITCMLTLTLVVQSRSGERPQG
jgi:hypothetical protein